MNKAMTLVLFVSAFAFFAKADDDFSIDGGTTGTSLENQDLGAFNPELDDQGMLSKQTFWRSETDENGATVKSYEDVPPKYDYSAKGTRRNELFDLEPDPRTGTPGENNQFLSLDLDEPLDRLIISHTHGSTVTNAFVKTSGYDGIYADTLVKFTTATTAPDVDADDRIVVWMREAEEDGRVVTNLVITAGRYDGNFKTVLPADYVITNAVAAGIWCRLTIRAISDVTEYRTSRGAASAEKALGFAVYLDGRPAVVAEGEYDIGTVAQPDLMTPEARILKSERRLFPALSKAGTDRAVSLSCFSFAGQGDVDDVLFTTECPEHVVKDNVFTLHWDAGIVSEDMLCIISNATGIVTNHINAKTDVVRYRDFALGANWCAQVTVTNVVYDYAHEFTNGLWSAKYGCTVTNDVFYFSNATNPAGYVASTRKYIGIGTNGTEGCSATFAEAKARLAATNGVKTLVMESDLVIVNTNKSCGLANYDTGYFPISEGDFVLDLNGHVLKGSSGTHPTIDQTGGSLRIIDSDPMKRGRVAPPDVISDREGVRTALKVYASAASTPTNVIEAGWFDGAVVITGKVATTVGHKSYKPVCVVDGGCFTNFYDAAKGFYLDQYVTNATACFSLRDGFWQTVTNGCVWCGKGEDSRWTTPGNWRGNALPGADDVAMFPYAPKPWTVDFGEGVAAKLLWMDGDIALSGTNEFSDVTVVSGAGRFVGDGVMSFCGRLPGKLTEEGTAAEVRLGEDWQGTVRVSGIETATNIADIAYWGNADSKVEFNGVRGYLMFRKDYVLPFELVLTDDGSTPAWKNETGYSGKYVSFPKLSGTGTFDSQANLHYVLQDFRFRDVSEFTGKFKMGGKRLVLGEGSSALDAQAGYVTFANGVRVRTGKDFGWTAVGARFGKTLCVSGELNDVLLTVGDGKVSELEARSVAVYRTGSDGRLSTNSLTVVDGSRIVITNLMPIATSSMRIKCGSSMLSAADAGSSVKAGSTLAVPAGSDVSIAGHDVMVGGLVASSIASYYAITEDAGVYTVSFDEAEVQPQVADFALSSEEGGIAEFVVRNARAGLWYGIETRTSLAAEKWLPSADWVLAEEDGDELYLAVPATGGSGCFYRVVVTDKEP